MSEPRSKSDTISKTAETYILEKVHEKITGLVKQGVDNYSTQWGIEHEPLAAKWYAKITNNIIHDPCLCLHEDIDGFSCTPDYFVNSDGLTEIKCPANGANHLKHCFISSDEYFKKEHPEYYWQCMAQMHITKREWCDFVSFDPRINSNIGMFIYRLKYDAEQGKKLESKVTEAREVYNSYLLAFDI